MNPDASVRIQLAPHSAQPDLQAIYERDFDGLVRLARVLVGESGLAEELVQDTFARLLERGTSLVVPDNMGAYVRTSLLNACRSRVRRLILERRHLSTAERQVGSPPGEHHGADDELRQAILKLPMRQRQCVALRYYDDQTVHQIAELLAVSPGSVKTHLHRGLERLRTLVEEEL